ncbi:MAG: carboxymuconolactone decarboxylase family protein [Kiloniellales bacterium]
MPEDLIPDHITPEDATNPGRPLRHETVAPEILEHLGKTPALIGDFGAHCGLPPALFPLIELRASQINGCAFCVKMHVRDARKLGETQDRLDRLVVWDQVSDFSAMERAVLAWTEALTRLERGTDYAALRTALRAHLSEQQISAVTLAVGMINLWNRIQVSNH